MNVSQGAGSVNQRRIFINYHQSHSPIRQRTYLMPCQVNSQMDPESLISQMIPTY
jgi:hypothetical protein